MENTITILTACSRPQYLEEIYSSIVNQRYNSWKWIISFDFDKMPDVAKEIKKDERVKMVLYKNKPTDVTCYAALNNIFDNYLNYETWIHVIDDDNILYPNYFNIINDVISINPLSKFILYGQQYRNGTHRMQPKTKDIREGMIDMAQVCFHSFLIEDTKYVQKYTADGIFYQTLFNKIKHNHKEWVWYNRYICYYNYILNETQESSLIRQNELMKIYGR